MVDQKKQKLRRSMARGTRKFHEGTSMSPTVIEMNEENALRELEDLRDQHPNARVHDSVAHDLLNFFLRHHPDAYEKWKAGGKERIEVAKILKPFYREVKFSGPNSIGYGTWVYRPLKDLFDHFPKEDEYRAVTTTSLLGLYTQGELDTISNATIGVVGQSVGMAQTKVIAMTGVSHFKIGDKKPVNVNTLSRLGVEHDSVGVRKDDVAEDWIIGHNPYAIVEKFGHITAENTERFLDGLDVVVLALDDPDRQIKLREQIHARGIPMVSMADTGRIRGNLQTYARNCPIPDVARAVERRFRKKFVKKGLNNSQKLIGLLTPDVASLGLTYAFEQQAKGEIADIPQGPAAVALGAAVAGFSAIEYLVNPNMHDRNVIIDIESIMGATSFSEEATRRLRTLGIGLRIGMKPQVLIRGLLGVPPKIGY